MADAFGIGTSALSARQQAIKTTGQNIANVNTEGYSRQRVEFVTRTPENAGGYYIGSGTEVSSVSRSYDQFLQTDFQRRTSSATYFSSLAQTAGRVDELFADEATGIGPALNEFFNSLEAVANSPTTLPERQVMISQAETLAQRFDYFDSRLSEFQNELNVKISTSASDVNQYAEVIAELNGQISLQNAQTGGNPSPDLLDRRDQAVTELSALIATTTQAQDDGSINVFIGKGQPLVIGASPSRLDIQPDPLQPNRLNIFVATGDQQGVEITGLMDGGEIGAALAAYDDVIDQARRDIGTLAAGLTITFNQVHREGYGLTSPTNGLDFFDPAAGKPADPAAQTSNLGTASITAIIDDPLNPADDGNIANVTGDNYRLDYSGGNLTALNLTTGETQSFAVAGTNVQIEVDGVTLTIDDASLFAEGDTYYLSPTGSAAANFGVNLSDPNLIAAAQDPNAPGDNRNMQLLIGLQDEATLSGEASYNDFYTNATSKIAVQTRRANSLAETEASLLASADSRRSNLAGVNLEEEAANLIRFQQAFQAAAQVIATARDVFDVLIRSTE